MPEQERRTLGELAQRPAGPPRMRAATWGEIAEDRLRDLYEAAAAQPLGRVADALGLSDLQGMVRSASEPPDVLAGTVDPLPKPGIRAYHGSPHDFERFDLSKIGTGEGAQTYGHGLYFAEREGTARSYREKLAEGKVKLYGQEHSVPAWRGDFDPHTRLVRRLADNRAGRAAAPETDIIALTRRQIEEGLANPFADRTALQRELELLDRAVAHPAGVETLPGGKMYEVNIAADPETLLDWDAPLHQQSIPVQTELGTRLSARELGLTGSQLHGGVPTGEDIYSRLGRREVASKYLRDVGIPGIKYLDQLSRAAGEGTRNYVMFDDALIDILRKYSLLLGGAGLGAAGAATQAAQPTRPQR